MPIYEFECEDCGETFEELVFGSAEGVKCRKCGSDRVRRLMSAFGFKSGSRFVSSSGPAGGCSGCAGGTCSSCH
ncbi:zinc ribbon domain-containing protein [Thermosulfurimonas marina]|uniref:Zinc ribbon domain-containing protein n=1 Tax=Thermosulfurimonas marina TaxID=2047767 RepID=A0A6H1WS47_9BACT|nr:zinc ribbon domain-containing protein [Thermosulfurimonas marina]QJA05956.1 zinc ribbon domain-containing protein [Thermosulfurimonas marina]